MPAISSELRGIIWVVTGIATVIFGILSFVLEPNLRYLVRRIFPKLWKKGGRPPAKKPGPIWLVYIVLVIMMVMGTASASTLPYSEPPLAKTLHYFFGSTVFAVKTNQN
jgi:hypothetical protein